MRLPAPPPPPHLKTEDLGKSVLIYISYGKYRQGILIGICTRWNVALIKTKYGTYWYEQVDVAIAEVLPRESFWWKLFCVLMDHL